MRHPILTVYPKTKDGPQMEWTAVSLGNGSVEVYVEVPKEEIDWDFAHLTMIVPQNEISESYGFSKEEIMTISDKIKNMSEDILEYIGEREDELCQA